MENEVVYIKLDDIIPNRFQPREVFDQKALDELAESIKQHGVLEPILVRPVSNKYEIIAGERRYKASAIAGLTTIPALVRNMDDKESSIVAYIENAQRKDVSAIESAKTAQRILKSNNMTQEELAASLGISQSSLANKIRLLSLPLEVQDSVMKGEISERHARSLLSVKEEKKQLELLKRIKETKMTVRELDGEIKAMNNGYMDFNNNGNVPNQNSNVGESNFMSFLNNSPVSNNPQMNSQDNFATSGNGFMDYLNNYDNSNPLPSETGDDTTSGGNKFLNNVGNEQQTPQDTFTTSGNGFMDYLNNFDNSNPIPPENEGIVDNSFTNFLNNNEVVEPANTQDTFTTSGNGFMDYLNNFDNSNPLPPTNKEGNQETNTNENLDPNFTNFLNSYSEPTQPANTQDTFTTNGNGFMDYLNNYDNNNPLPSEGTNQETNTNNNLDPNFTNFLNNYNEPTSDNVDNTFAEYLNDYDKNNPVFNEPNIEQITDDEDHGNNNIASLNANSYVEDNPNYVDVSTPTSLSTVDEIIDELKTEITKIKGQSKFKIDTEEINFDDIYQVTIKIDKRDF